MKEKILIVDDDKDTRDILTDVLVDEDYDVFSAYSGRTAINRVKKEKPALILLDIKMPKMNGIEVLERVKKIDKTIMVVMITGYGALDTAKESMNLGAFDYITKPFDINFIKKIVREALLEKKRRSAGKRRRV